MSLPCCWHAAHSWDYGHENELLHGEMEQSCAPREELAVEQLIPCPAALPQPAAVCSGSHSPAPASLTLPWPWSTLLSDETVQHFLCVQELEVVFLVSKPGTWSAVSYTLDNSDKIPIKQDASIIESKLTIGGMWALSIPLLILNWLQGIILNWGENPVKKCIHGRESAPSVYC